jgi:threonine dehydratase
LKCENLQLAGAFKYRGACNAILSLSEEEKRRGVATHSSGNHAQAVARAAQQWGMRAFIVMPKNAPAVKLAAVRGYGGIVTQCEPTLQAREEALNEIITREGASLVHPYNDYRVMAGQGTATLELLQSVPELDAVIAPVSGGGLLSGTCVAARGLKPDIEMYGAEPATADDARRSLAEGRIIIEGSHKSIADGLLANLGDKTFPLLQEHVTAIIPVTEEETIAAMRFTWERAKLVIEPSSAVAIAAVIKSPEHFAGKRVGVIVSGGNVDLDHLPWM